MIVKEPTSGFLVPGLQANILVRVLLFLKIDRLGGPLVVFVIVVAVYSVAIFPFVVWIIPLSSVGEGEDY